MKREIRRTLVLSALSLLAGGSLWANGQDAGSAPVPGPSAELGQLAVFAGTWKCDGEAPANPLGAARKYTAEAVVAPSLNGAWFDIRYRQLVGPTNPLPQELQMTWGYDAAAKQFHRSGHSNLGVWDVATSPGWQGTTFVWTGETGGPMPKTAMRNTIVKKGEREFTLSTELKLKKKWVLIGADTCKR